MNFTTQYANDLAARISQISPLSILMTIRAYYLRYLWNYESDSWVARMAYACRVLAVLISLPLVVLALLVSFSFYPLARPLLALHDRNLLNKGHFFVHSRSNSWSRRRRQGIYERQRDSTRGGSTTSDPSARL
jgi:hypothetical protein